MITEILSIVFGGTSLVSIIGFLIYRKENRKLKALNVESEKNNVESGDIDNASKTLDLVEKYKQLVMDITSDRTENTELTRENNVQLKELKCMVKEIDVRTSNIESYLDGPYTKFLSSQQKVSAVKRGRKPKTVKEA